MESGLQRKPHWSAGSYVDLVLAAISMQILFFITSFWLGTYGSDFRAENTTEVDYSVRIQLGLGWLMCILAGIGFSILPLIYDVVGFEKTLMRVYIGLNIFGQIAITIGIMSNNLSIFHSLSTIGITLLSVSIICLWSPAITILKSKSENGKNVGPFSFALGSFLPILGFITLLSWTLRGEFDGLLQLSEQIVFDLFFSLALVAIIISHINRRLDWEIIKPKDTGKVFGIYATLLVLAIISKHLHEADEISSRIAAFMQLIPYLFIFIMLKPLKIISNIKNKRTFNAMVVISVFWLPMIGFAAFLESMSLVQTSEAMMSFYRWILIFGVAFQVFWGFTSFLHNDHKKKSLQTRKQNWISLLAINLGTLVTVSAMFVSWQQDEVVTNYIRIGIAFYAVAYISILTYWIKETFICLYTWHKIPMFYDQYLAHPEQGSGYSGED